MPDYLTPSINRTDLDIEFSGEFSALVEGQKADLQLIDPDTGLVLVGGKNQRVAYVGWEFHVPWDSAWLDRLGTLPPAPHIMIWRELGSIPSARFPGSVTPVAGQEYWFAAVANGFGATDLAVVSFASASVISYMVSGTWRFSAQADEVLHPYFMDEGVRGADGSPTYGGPATDDIVPRAQGAHFYVQTQSDGLVVAQCELSVSGHGSDTATASGAAGVEVALGHYPTGRISVVGIGQPITATATFTDFGDEAVDAANDSQTSGSPPVTIRRSLALSGDDVVLTVAAEMTAIPDSVVGQPPPPLRDGSGIGFLTIEPQDELGIAGKAFSMTDDYPDELTLRYTRKKSVVDTLSLNPFGSEEWVRRSYGSDAVGTINGGSSFDLTSRAADEKEPLLSWMDDEVLQSYGEDKRDWRTGWYGFVYEVGTVEKSAAVDVGGGTGASRSWSPSPGNWEGYRYLKVRLKNSDAGTYTFVAEVDGSPGKSFEASATVLADTYTDVIFDLCRPVGFAGVQIHDTRYPVEGDGLPASDPELWGVGRIVALDITGGTTLTVDTIELIHHVNVPGDPVTLEPTIGFGRVFNWWERTQEDGEIIEAYMGWMGDANGRRSCDVPIASRQLFESVGGSTFWVYSQRTIRQGITDLEATPGWNVVETFAADPLDTWHRLGDSGSAAFGSQSCWLMGSGFTVTGNLTGDYSNHVSRELGAGLDVVAQSMWDEARVWPRAGEVWLKGAPGGVTWLRTGKVLRGAFMGFGHPVGGTFTSFESPGVNPAGSGALDEVGHFLTGSPFLRMDEELPRVFFGSWPSNIEQAYRSKARRFWRFAAVNSITDEGTNLAIDVHPDGTAYRAYVIDGVVWCGFASPGGGWQDVAAGIDGTWVALKVVKGAPVPTLFLWVHDGGDIKEYESTTQGRTWGMARTIAAGNYPAAEIEKDNTRYVYWVDSGAIKGEISAADGMVVFGPATVKTGVDDSGIAVRMHRLGNGQYQLRLLASVSGSVTEYTSTDGRTFV